MKALLVAAVFAVGSVIALSGGSQSDANSQDSMVQQQMDRFDSALQNGLSEKTHDEIATQAQKSATWLQGFGDDVKSKVSE